MKKYVPIKKMSKKMQREYHKSSARIGEEYPRSRAVPTIRKHTTEQKQSVTGIMLY